MPEIRLIAICIFRNGDCILVIPGFDSVSQTAFYRPPGGSIEFGEHSADAVRREIREEFGEEISDLTYLGVLENQFFYRGSPSHEVAFVYEARFDNQKLAGQESIEIQEAGWAGPAEWIDPTESGAIPLFPAGLLDLI